MNKIYKGAKYIKKYIKSVFDKKRYTIRFGEEYKEAEDEQLIELYMIYEHIENLDIPDLVLYDGKYYGEVLNNERNGTGVMKYADGNDEYIGYWKNNVRHGMGIMKWEYNENYHSDTTMLAPKIYVGNFENNAIHGHGKLHYTNGFTYIGNFENGAKHGKGLYYNKDLHLYGKWVDSEFKKGFIYRKQSGVDSNGIITYFTVAKYLHNGRVRYASLETDFVFLKNQMEYDI
jgi:hypothetical protein